MGDVNATLACSVTARKENIRCCHIEAGLRSGDMTMPEEINRIVTDRISDLLLAPDEISVRNLFSEGVPDNKIVMTGNIMIDTLDYFIGTINSLSKEDIIRKNLADRDHTGHDFVFEPTGKFALVTLHRP